MAAATAVTYKSGYAMMITGSFTLDPASLAAAGVIVHTVAVPEARAGDIAIVTKRAANVAGEVYGPAYVAADGTISIPQYNPSGGAVDVASATWDYALIRGQLGPFGTG